MFLQACNLKIICKNIVEKNFKTVHNIFIVSYIKLLIILNWLK